MSASMLCSNQHCLGHCRNHTAFVDARPAVARKCAAGNFCQRIVAHAAGSQCEEVCSLLLLMWWICFRKRASLLHTFRGAHHPPTVIKDISWILEVLERFHRWILGMGISGPMISVACLDRNVPAGQWRWRCSSQAINEYSCCCMCACPISNGSDGGKLKQHHVPLNVPVMLRA